ncbi:MAG: aminotransferase class I/II-fold pyridoxal phosphate-dependent enzyme [Fuerstiella sp.]
MKAAPADFAVLGGPPEFAEPLMVGRPALPDRDELLNRIGAVLDSGQLTNDGPVVREFEAAIAEYLNVRHAVAVCNGTMALQIMLKAAGLTGEVIVPSLTFVATAHAVEWLGLTPVFADVDPHSQTLDAASISKCLSDRTSAILAVHLWGNLCDAERLQELADRHGLQLLFDASHAFGCHDGQRLAGSFGGAEAFSFHATKVMHCIEGGAITTNDERLAERARLMRNFGITGLSSIESAGTNGKLNELNAAAGLCGLSMLPQIIERNRQNLASYQTVLQPLPGIELMQVMPAEQTNAQYVVAEVGPDFGMSRDDLLAVLRAEGIFARSYFNPGCHNAEPYAGHRKHQPIQLPVTERLLRTLIQLPTGLQVDAAQIARIGSILQSARKWSSELKRALATTPPEWHPHDPAAPRDPSWQKVA